MTLQSLGWSAFFEAHLQNTASRPCRVVSDRTDLFLVHDGEREAFAVTRGRLRNQPTFPPVVGHWALGACANADRYVVKSSLPSRRAMVRKQAASRMAPP